jgi:ribosomal protein S18 acetylase RimI-like enzyme
MMSEWQILQICDPVEALQLAQRVVEQFVLPTFSKEAQRTFPEILAQDIVKNFSDSDTEAFGIRADQKLIGYIAIAKHSHILELFVLSDEQHRGIGRSLLDFAENRAKDFNISKMTVRASLNAVSFYQRCGFEPTSEAQEIRGIRFQPMQKLLSSC